MTAPFALLFLRLPSVAAISALVLFTNILSTFWYQHQIEYHYSLIAVPALSIGTVYAIGAVRERVEWSGQVVPLRARGGAGARRRHADHGVPLGAAAVGAAARSFVRRPEPCRRGRRPRADGRDPRRRRRVGQLPAHAAPGVSGGDLPVPDAVPGRAVRARHVDRGVTPGGPRRPGRVRDDPDRPGRSAAGATGPSIAPAFDLVDSQRLLAPLPNATPTSSSRRSDCGVLAPGPERTELSAGRGGGGRGGRR